MPKKRIFFRITAPFFLKLPPTRRNFVTTSEHSSGRKRFRRFSVRRIFRGSLKRNGSVTCRRRTGKSTCRSHILPAPINFIDMIRPPVLEENKYEASLQMPFRINSPESKRWEGAVVRKKFASFTSNFGIMCGLPFQGSICFILKNTSNNIAWLPLQFNYSIVFRLLFGNASLTLCTLRRKER